MTLAEAVKNIEDALDARGAIHDPDLRDNVLDVCSGGIRQKGGVHPALYASEADAVESWRYAAIQAIGEYNEFSRPRFNWIEKPEVCRLQMTMADLRAQHRVVTDRFAVESRIAIAQ